MTTTFEQQAASPSTQAFLSKEHKLLINGQWVSASTGKTFEVIDPAIEKCIAKVAEGDRQDVDNAVRAARQAFEAGPWKSMTPSERGKLIWKLADLIEENTDLFAELECLDNGKPCAVAKAADVPLTVDHMRYYAGWATKIEGTTIPISVPYMPDSQFHAYTLQEPIGVVGQIIPWNFPLLMAAWKLGVALATGCTVVLKPAEQTPLTALLLGQLVQEAGIPNGVVNIVTGFGETAGAAIAAHPDVDKVAFTGSTEVGKLILKAAAGNLKKVSLELGGKSPNIIFADSNLELAIPAAASAIFFNHGQCCCAGSRLYAEASIFDEVVEGVANEAKKIQVGAGMNANTGMGPLVSQEQLDRVTQYMESGKAEGATAVCGGTRLGNNGYFVEPTVFTNTKPNMKIVEEEIFGPVVTAMPFNNPEEITPIANNSTYGLAAGVWTQDTSKAHRTAKQLKAGTVWINCYNVFDAALPFGGYKQSGWGREMGKQALELYTQTKAVCMHL